MSESQPSAPESPNAAPPAGRGIIFLTPGEFYWITLGVFIGGIFILTLLPYLLIPRLGGPLAIASSYFVFFVAWQPIQMVTQRTFGTRTAFVRMIIFVAGAATIASYLRMALPTLTGGG